MLEFGVAAISRFLCRRKEHKNRKDGFGILEVHHQGEVLPFLSAVVKFLTLSQRQKAQKLNGA